jgi:hypothetical protein
MTTDETSRIEKRVDKMDERLEAALELMHIIYTDVKIIKSTCETRGATCSKHFIDIEEKVSKLETDIDGGSEAEGMRVRVSKLESRDSSKEKYLYLIIGALLSGGFALFLFLLQHLLSR